MIIDDLVIPKQVVSQIKSSLKEIVKIQEQRKKLERRIRKDEQKLTNRKLRRYISSKHYRF